MKRGKGNQRVYPPSERDLEKQRQRDLDAERLRRGEPMAQDPFTGIPLSQFKITHIGRRRIGDHCSVNRDLTDEQFNQARARAVAELVDFQPGVRTSLFAGMDGEADDAS